MSQEQRDNNLGIDPELSQTDPVEYQIQLEKVRRKLLQEMEDAKKKEADQNKGLRKED